MSTDRDPLSAPVIRVPDHLRAFVGDTAHDGEMRAAVKARLLTDFAGDQASRPFVDEVIVAALGHAARECTARAEAMDHGFGGDDMGGRAVALRYLAAWLDPEHHQRPDEEGQ